MADLPEEWVHREGDVSALVDASDIDRAANGSLRAAVIAAGVRWAAGQRRLVRLVGNLDQSEEWALDGSPSCAHWVADAVDVEVCTAREWVRIGRSLLQLDVIDNAFEQGLLSYSKVRALTRIATPETQVELCALARRVPAARLSHALAGWLARNETPEQTDARHHGARSFTSRLDLDGMLVGTFRLPPIVGSEIVNPVEALIVQGRASGSADHAPADASSAESVARWPSLAQQRADALVALVRGGGAPVATEIVLHVRGDGCSLDDGTPITESAVARIAPEAFLRALIHDAEGRPINASGRQRHPTTRQRRVVQARDRACVDCGASECLQYDHEPDYEVSHHTVVDELRLRCWACHRSRHRRK
jgi:hypothetical protein